MKRNKRTVTMGHEDLTPLTEHILAQMGDEGVDIRERLKQLYRRRYLKNPPIFQEHLDNTA
jgi:thermostable 8-oxoguanine DNA glycosylase